MAAALACGMTEDEAKDIYLQLGIDATAVLSQAQFDTVFGGEDIPLRIPFERSTW